MGLRTGNAVGMPDNAISLLRADHGNIEELFHRFEGAPRGAYAEKRRIMDHVIEQLSQHAALEEQVFYPALRGYPDLHDQVLESLEEHHAAKLALAELEKLPANAERFDAKTAVLIDSVRRHVREEQEEVFPAAERHIPFTELQTMAGVMEDLRRVAPTRPHPFAPDQPPLNIVVGIPTAFVDFGMRVAWGVVRTTGGAILHITGMDRSRQAAHRGRAGDSARRSA